MYLNQQDRSFLTKSQIYRTSRTVTYKILFWTYCSFQYSPVTQTLLPLSILEIQILFCFAVGALTKANGKTAKDTALEQKREEDGYIVENGRKGSKEDTESDSRTHQPPNTKGRGQTDCKTDMDQKHTPMMVRKHKYIIITAHNCRTVFTFFFLLVHIGTNVGNNSGYHNFICRIWKKSNCCGLGFSVNIFFFCFNLKYFLQQTISSPVPHHVV